MAADDVTVRLSLRGRRAFSADAKHAERDIKGVGDSANRSSKGMRAASKSSGVLAGGMKVLRSAAKLAAVGIGLAAVALGHFVLTGIKSLNRIERFNAQTKAVIKSTAGIAGVSYAQVLKTTGRLEDQTGIEQELLQDSANNLLTFTAVRNQAGKGNDIFSQAQVRALDLSVARHISLASASTLLGKALQDPVKGMTAMRRVGVDFSKQQGEQVKAMVASGNTLGAQKLIMAELRKEYGGSAQAYGRTTSGMMAKIGHAYGTFKETVVSGLQPQIRAFMRVILGAVRGVGGSLDLWMPRAQRFFDRIARAMHNALPAFRALTRAVAAGDWGRAGRIFADMLPPGLAGAMKTVVGILGDLGRIIKDSVAPALADMGGSGVLASVSTLGLLSVALKVMADHADVVRPLLKALLPVLLGLYTVHRATKAITGVKNAMGGLDKTMKVFKGHPGLVALVAGILAITYAYKHFKAVRNVFKWFADHPVLTTILLGIAAAIYSIAAATVVLDIVTKANPLILIAVALVAVGAGIVYLWKHVSWFRNGLKSVGRAFMKYIIEPSQEMRRTLMHVFDAISDRAGRIWGGLGNGLDSAINGAIGLLNKLIRALNRLNFTFHIPHIPGTNFGGDYKIGISGLKEVGYVGDLGKKQRRKQRGRGDKPPKMHSGGSIGAIGGALSAGLGGLASAIIRPDEEMVMLPPRASVVPLRHQQPRPSGDGGTSVAGLDRQRQPLIVNVQVDRKTVAKAVIDGINDRVARQ